MDKPVAYSLYSVSPFHLVGFVVFFISQRILQIYSGFQSLLQSQLNLLCGSNLNVLPERKNQNPERLNKQSSFDEKVDDGKLCRGDVEMVMEKLGIFGDPDGEKLLQERLGMEGLLHLFEENGDPTSEELTEAFEAFDENRDGYIDAEELQRVLSALGFVEGLELGECKRMIAAFDTNEDGRIDFIEFVKIVEISFC